MVDAFFSSEFEGGRHARRVGKDCLCHGGHVRHGPFPVGDKVI